MIRALINLFCIFTIWVSTNAQPKAEFEKKTIDFGTVVEGSICKHSFKFRNTGNKPLIISDVSVTCGCTVPRWSPTPVMPGDTSSVYIEYNSFNKMGPQAKGVNLTTNCPEPLIGLIIMANIIPDSNFKVIIDSTSYKSLRFVDQKSFFQLIIPIKKLSKKGFKGDGYDLEKIVRLISTVKDVNISENVWYTSDSNKMVMNTFSKEIRLQFAKILTKELSKKKKVRYWQKKTLG